MGYRLNERKAGKYAELSNCYKALINGLITITYAADASIDLAGTNTITDFNAALVACKVDNIGLSAEALALVDVRVRDMHKVSHTVTYAQLELIIGLGCSKGNALWNKKVDLQEECNAIDDDDYITEDAAIDAVSAIVW